MVPMSTPEMFLHPKRAGFLGPSRIVGTFGGSDALLPGILEEPVDYLSIGPVFRNHNQADDNAPDRS